MSSLRPLIIIAAFQALLCAEAAAADISVQSFEQAKKTEITSTIASYLRPLDETRGVTHRELVTYYRKILGALSARIPAVSPTANNLLNVYSGKLALEEPETFQAPCLLIAPRSYDLRSLRLYQFEVSDGGAKFPGLEVRGRLAGPLLKAPVPKLSELYVSDLNARLAGFRYAQLMTGLSANVEPARKFAYNGLHDWSSHPRYRAEDQALRPIELNNYAHRLGDVFTLSPQPDFALELSNYRTQEIVLTFFLWRDAPAAGKTGEPDLIYRLVLEPA